jgi:hypothetical protein
MAEDAGIFQVNKMARGFGLGKIQDLFQVGYAHFTVHKNQVQDTQARFVCASLENLGS